MSLPPSERIGSEETYDRLQSATEAFEEDLPPAEEINILLEPDTLDRSIEYLEEIAEIVARSENRLLGDIASSNIMRNVPGLSKQHIRTALAYKIDEATREIELGLIDASD